MSDSSEIDSDENSSEFEDSDFESDSDDTDSFEEHTMESTKGYTPLHMACLNRFREEDVIGFGKISINNSKNKNKNTPLMVATFHKNIRVALLLLDFGADVRLVNREGATALHFACKIGSELLVKNFIKRGANVNADGYYLMPLYLAIYSSHTNIAKILIDNGADINARNQNLFAETAMHAACQKGIDEIFELLLTKNADFDVKTIDNRNPFCVAAKYGHKNIVKRLLDLGVYVDSKDTKSRTALSYACKNGSNELVQILLEHGANVDISDYHGCTPLHHAAKKGNSNIVEILLQFGADVNAVDAFGKTPLAIACSLNQFSVVIILFRYCPNPNLLFNNNVVVWPLNTSGNIAHLICTELVKAKAACFYINNKTKVVLDFMTTTDFSNFEIICENEIKKIKNVKVLNSNYSIHDFFIKDPSRTAISLKNKKTLKDLEKIIKNKIQYPIYGEMITHKVKSIYNRLVLANSSSRYLIHIFNYKLPHFTAHQIISYLSVKDLKNFVDACYYVKT